jgi:hypothetical protein
MKTGLFDMEPVVLIGFFRYLDGVSKWKAFQRMGRPPLLKENPEGLQFWKMLGVGGGKGFSVLPDFSTYCLLTVFDSEANAEAFVQSSVVSLHLEGCASHGFVYMRTLASHGLWSGLNPFLPVEEMAPDRPLAVITRAAIKPGLAWKFWRYVPAVSASMQSFPGKIFSKGVGEWPVFMQATFSIWTHFDAMKSYAYDNPAHREMIQKTRSLGWYSEELFARFHPYRLEGPLLQFPL